MFVSPRHLQNKTAKFSKDRQEYLQQLVTEYSTTVEIEAKQQIVANLANFCYDPINFDYMEKLNIIDLFTDVLQDNDEKLIEFAIAGLCNLTAHVNFQEKVMQTPDCLQLIMKCLSRDCEETLISAMTTLIQLLHSQKDKLTVVEIVNAMKTLSFSENKRIKNLALLFLKDTGTVPY
ncbi:unnamed protein product [Dimorphilus gyrociliatus]|uniref:Uncharacterized protein n=1 Tax=Dimorphilus gyrociliatus TaxID=2664684 RepID=A0A7I8V7X7_9ANNE|nr:unnamed protein product [Dimorphilus gyrociliatus]